MTPAIDGADGEPFHTRWFRSSPAASPRMRAFRMLEGRWKMVIVFHLFDRQVLRFSELERAIPGVSQKMLIQQLRDLERDGIVERVVYPRRYLARGEPGQAPIRQRMKLSLP